MGVDNTASLLRNDLRGLAMSYVNESQVSPLLVSIRDTAKLLGVSEKTIRNQCSTLKFPIRLVKIGGRSLFRMSDINELVSGGQTSAAPVIQDGIESTAKRGRGRQRKSASCSRGGAA